MIPVKTKSGFMLVGVITGNRYNQGLVVYTEKELTPNMLEEKAKKAGVEISVGLFEAYLSQMPNFRISKMVGVKHGLEFCLEYA
ncbi:hypothetical protein [Gynuella sp.]|uniref:hypothetical protein n=1 Tax=Gynuella sp. TaxID=2969146 RepID=UPI003D0F763A